MDELLHSLPPGSLVLDLGCAAGSLSLRKFHCKVIAIDCERPAGQAPAGFVQADAACLPFPPNSFAAVISNHSLEHFVELEQTISEIGRVLARPGKLYVAVPDASTLSDRLYRWLAKGGGHVNAFISPKALAESIQLHVQEPLAAIRPLCSSLSFLNSRNHPSRAPRKLLLIGGGNETVLVFLNRLLRLSDRLLGTRLSFYGWALYFGTYPERIDEHVWTDVCARCGAGHPAKELVAQGALRAGGWLAKWYSCPNCHAMNLFTTDHGYSGLSREALSVRGIQ